MVAALQAPSRSSGPARLTAEIRTPAAIAAMRNAAGRGAENKSATIRGAHRPQARGSVQEDDQLDGPREPPMPAGLDLSSARRADWSADVRHAPGPDGRVLVQLLVSSRECAP